MSNAVVMYTGGELVRVVNSSTHPPRAARVESDEVCESPCGRLDTNGLAFRGESLLVESQYR